MCYIFHIIYLNYIGLRQLPSATAITKCYSNYQVLQQLPSVPIVPMMSCAPLFHTDIFIHIEIGEDTIIPLKKHTKRVVFTPETKTHDGLKPASLLLNDLVLYYLSIGGMNRCEEMVEYLINQCKIREFGDFRLHYIELETMAKDLLKRLESSEETPILIEGGGSNCILKTITIPNVKHLVIVLETTRNSMIGAGSFPYNPSSTDAS